jgi:signal transduction histidine kinase
VIAAALTSGGWLAAGLATLVAVLIRRSQAGATESTARVVHELRGPLAAARLGLHTGVRDGELTPARLRAVDLELARAGLALDDLTHVGRGGQPPRSLREEVEVSQLVADSVEARRPSAAARGGTIALRWSGDAGRVCGDRVRLAQATGNLIANAIEHGGSPIEVRGRVEGGAVWIEVLDAGPGLPAPLAELARRPRRGRGTRGRGLAIASSIAEQHGGRIAAAAAPAGARLVLELPLAGAAGTSAVGVGPMPTH